MGYETMVWALKYAPVESATERVVLAAICEVAGDDGEGAWSPLAIIADQAVCDVARVHETLAALEARGIIRPSARVARDPRVPVWDVQIPYGWYGTKIARVNADRAARGQPPLTEQNRPPLPPPDRRQVRG